MLTFDVSNQFDFESEDYRALFAIAEITAFQHPNWMTAMQQLCQTLPDLTVKHLVMRCADSEQLVGLVPLISRKVMRTQLLEYANLGIVDYAVPILHPDFAKWLPRAAQTGKHLEDALGAYDILRIKHLPHANSAIMRLFPNGQINKAEFSSHAIHFGDDYDAWRLEAISKAERRSRDKKRRALMRRGDWQMRRLFDPKEIEEAFIALRDFRKPRFENREGDDAMQSPHLYQFYLDLAREHAESGYANTYIFTLDGEIKAVQFGIAHEQTYLYLMIGIDYESVGRHSPGLLMVEDSIRDCMERGMTCLDLTIGDEPYKTKFGTVKAPIYTLVHGQSMLGSMGVHMAGIMTKGGVPTYMRKWLHNA